MSSAVLAWLDARAAAVPLALAARMRAAVQEAEEAAHGATAVPQLLGDAALACARSALPHCEERQAALHLLAADGLLTYALEAAADEPDALADIVELFAPARLNALLAADDGTDS